MKNSEFIRMLIVTGKLDDIDGIYTVDETLKELDNSVFDYSRYYKRFKDNINDINKFYNDFYYITNRGYDSTVEQSVYELLEFLLEIMVKKDLLVNAMNTVVCYGDPHRIGNFRRIVYRGVMGKRFNINNDILKLDYEFHDRGYIVKLKDKKGNVQYRNVKGIEKDLQTNEIRVVTDKIGSSYGKIQLVF